MAPTDQKMKSKKVTGRDDSGKTFKNKPQGVKKKRKWVPEHKVFQGNVKEGQGFAFNRKQKVQYEYKKLLRKEKNKKQTESNPLYKDEYPEHLRHLYMAEAEKLKNEAWTNRMNRSKLRMKGQQKAEDISENNDDAPEAEVPHPDSEVTGGSEVPDSVAESNETTSPSDRERLPMSNRMRKKMLKKTSYQKTKEEFEAVKEKQRKKKEEYLQDKQQREEAIQKYKQKKMDTFQMLSKKTKKGQPNLNLQMEYLLQKIQGTSK
ncbi:uncharacterized protein V6R79_019264 [Siganus canaliculatus]